MRNAGVLDVAAIRRAHPIAEVIAAAGVELRRNGQRLVGCCPLHADRQPSLAVYPKTQSYFCYGCEAGGDVVDFVGRLHGLGFLDAVAWLGSGARHTPTGAPQRIAQSEPRFDADEASRAIAIAARLYVAQLDASPLAQAYLQRRGIDVDAARRLGVGYAGGSLREALQRGAVDLRAAHAVGLLRGDGDDALRGRIVVADVGRSGRATWVTGRAVAHAEPRYLNVRLPSPLLGAGRLRGENVVVTEGPFDWLTAAGWNLPAVALLGTHASRDALARLGRFRHVYLALDADEAGRRATDRIAVALGPRATAVPLPDGVNDLNELGRCRGGRQAFVRALRAARERREETRWQSVMARARLRSAA